MGQITTLVARLGPKRVSVPGHLHHSISLSPPEFPPGQALWQEVSRDLQSCGCPGQGSNALLPIHMSGIEDAVSFVFTPLALPSHKEYREPNWLIHYNSNRPQLDVIVICCLWGCSVGSQSTSQIWHMDIGKIKTGNGASSSGYLQHCPFTHRHCLVRWEQTRQEICSYPASHLPATPHKSLCSNALSSSFFFFFISHCRQKSHCEGCRCTIKVLTVLKSYTKDLRVE